MIDVHINGTKTCSLNAGEYYIAKIEPEQRTVEVCIESDQGRTCEELEAELFQTKIYLVSYKKKKPPILDYPNANIRNQISLDIQNGNIVKVCGSELNK